MKSVFSLVIPIGIASASFGIDSVTGNTEPVGADECFRVLRNNDLKGLKDMSRGGLESVPDRLNCTPLHFAALYGTTDSVRILLAAAGEFFWREFARTPLTILKGLRQ